MTTPLVEPAGSTAALPETPYVGLVPYDEADAPFFFGRERERRIVTANLRAARLTLLYGPSGVGKTSLLHAGVVSRLRESTGPSLAVAVVSSWRGEPLHTLTEAIRRAASAASGEELEAAAAGSPLVETLSDLTERVRRILVVLDQFEDYFLYNPDEDGEGTLFAELPRAVNEPNLRVNFLLSIREDALAKLDRFEGRIPNLFGNYLRVDYLTREDAREAIEGPIAEYNRRLPEGIGPFSIEPALVDAVVDAAASGRLGLAASGNGALGDEGPAGKVETPFLQLVMERLWRATTAAGSHRLTRQTLASLGGAQQIVENHLLEALGSLDPAERAAAADLFRFLVSRSKTKIAHSASDLAEWTRRPEPEVAAVLEKLCRGESGRLLRAVSPPAGKEEAPRYELFHDVLGEPIFEWRRRYEHERDRRAAIRRIGLGGGVLLGLVAAFAALGIWALVQRSSANHATESATSIALASAANARLATHPDVSLLLALEAVRRKPTPQARGSMISALARARSSGVQTILRQGAGPVYGVAFSPDGHTLASAGDDRTVRLWDARSHQPLAVLRGHTGPVNKVAFSPDGHTLASAGDDGTVRLWDTRTHQPLVVFRGAGQVNDVAFSPDGQTLAAAGNDGTLRLWDPRTHKPLAALHGTGSVYAVAFSPDGHTLAAAGDDRTVRLWDLRTRRALAVLRGHTARINSVAFGPDGHTLASASDDRTVRLWDARTHRPIAVLHGHTDGVEGVAFSSDGHRLASAGSDQTVRLWDTRTHQPLAVLRGHTGPVYSVAFSPDGHSLAAASDDQTVRLWDTLGQPPVAVLRGSAGGNIGVAFSPDGRTLASALIDRTVRLWDTRTQRPLAVLRGHTRPVYDVSFSPDGHLLASWSQDKTVRLWDTRTHRPLAVLRSLSGPVAFSPDGRTFASAGNDGTLRLLDTRTHQPLAVLHVTGTVYGVAFSPDGRTLAASGHDGTVHLWDARTHRPIAVLHGHTGAVWGIAFSPDGRTLASAGNDKTVRLWDTRTHQPVAVLTGHTDVVRRVAFSPDGHTLASASQDNSARLWDTRTRASLAVLHGSDNADAVAFSPDGQSLAVAYYVSLQLWKGIFWRDFNDLKQQVCSLVVGNLTQDEWQQLAPGLPYHTSCPVNTSGLIPTPVAVSVAAVTAATSTIAAPTTRSNTLARLVGTWGKTMSLATWHKNQISYEPAGRFSIAIAKKGVLSLFAPGYGRLTTMTVAASGASVTVGPTADGFCGGQGIYTWTVSGRTLALKLVKDDCDARRVLFTAGTWTRK